MTSRRWKEKKTNRKKLQNNNKKLLTQKHAVPDRVDVRRRKVRDARVAGVARVSRRVSPPEQRGPDFRPDALGADQQIALDYQP